MKFGKPQIDFTDSLGENYVTPEHEINFFMRMMNEWYTLDCIFVRNATVLETTEFTLRRYCQAISGTFKSIFGDNTCHYSP